MVGRLKSKLTLCDALWTTIGNYGLKKFKKKTIQKDIEPLLKMSLKTFKRFGFKDFPWLKTTPSMATAGLKGWSIPVWVST